MLKRYLLAAVLLPMASGAFATPIDLGSAGGYTLLATGYEYNGSLIGGTINLGSDAHIFGDVGARGTIIEGAGAEIHGAKYSGAAAPVDWQDVRSDLLQASLTARNLSGQNKGSVSTSETFSSYANTSVFDIVDFTLGSGDSLTLQGDADDQFIINIGGDFHLSGGAAITLVGVQAENVLFNVYSKVGYGEFTAAPGTLQGTFIAPYLSMTLGDGINPLGNENVRFLAGNHIGGNFQEIHGFGDDPGSGNDTGGPNQPDTPPVDVPAPPALLLFGLSLVGLALLARSRRSRRTMQAIC